MMRAEVGQAYQVGEAICHVPNVCCVCQAPLPLGTTASVDHVLGGNKYRNRIDAFCDRCAVKRRPPVEPLPNTTEE